MAFRISLAITYSHGHVQLQGRLGNIVLIPNFKIESRNLNYQVAPVLYSHLNLNNAH